MPHIQTSDVVYGVNPVETIITPRPDLYPPVKEKSEIPTNQNIKEIVREVASQYGWGDGKEWESLQWLITKESGWKPTAQNPTSTAFGLFQHLDQTRKNYGCPKTSDVVIQTHCGIRYIKARYKTPTETQKFWQIHKWY